MRFIHEQFVGVQAISALLAAAHWPTRLSFLVVRRVIRNSPAQAFADLHLIVSKVPIPARRA
jgi:hypothetical protein